MAGGLGGDGERELSYDWHGPSAADSVLKVPGCNPSTGINL